MKISKDQARALLRKHNLRVTAPRLAVLGVLADADTPLSHSEVLDRLGETDCDPATIYRNLVKLSDAQVAPIVSRAAGVDRYELIDNETHKNHIHPHFLCSTCGNVSCLPTELSISKEIEERWAASLDGATVEFRGECPECIGGA